jgi:TonB family protein
MLRAKNDDSDALDLLLEWREPVSGRRILRAGVGSILVHVAVVGLFLMLPSTSTVYQGGMVTVDLRKAVPLVAPRIFDPTQKEPNKEKVVKPELDIRSALPPAPPKARSFRPPAPVGAAAEPSPGAIPEPPQIQAVVVVPQIDGVVPTLPKPPEKPKITFDSIAPTSTGTPSEHAVIPNPKIAVDMGNAASQAGGGGGVLSSTGETEASSLRTPQLLSDPQGVDFKPYLLQVLALVRRNWLAVVPDSARTGQRGQVLVQFRIDRRGAVPKLVIATSSGIPAFDRAAIAGISASNPFPPLPAGYKGDEISLQLAFSYNLRSAVR